MKKNKKIDFKFKMHSFIDAEEFNFLIEVDGFTPSRPAPVCSNPSSPLFSDCGDDPNFDEYRVYVITDEDDDEAVVEASEEILDIFTDDIEERIFEVGDEEYYKDFDRVHNEYDSWN